MSQQVKDLALSLLWLWLLLKRGFNPWPGNFWRLWIQLKTKQNEINKKILLWFDRFSLEIPFFLWFQILLASREICVRFGKWKWSSTLSFLKVSSISYSDNTDPWVVRGSSFSLLSSTPFQLLLNCWSCWPAVVQSPSPACGLRTKEAVVSLRLPHQLTLLSSTSVVALAGFSGWLAGISCDHPTPGFKPFLA